MEIAHLAAFNAALLAAMASPGPALLLATTNTLRYGRAAGVLTGVGLSVTASAWTLAALLGLEAMFVAAPWAYAGLKIAGAAYLIWIAMATLRGADVPLAHDAGLCAQQGWRAFRQGLLVNATNPKSVLFAAAVIAVALPSSLAPGEIVLVTLNHLGVEVAVYSGLACLLARPSVARAHFRIKGALDRITALVLGALGLRLLGER